MSVFVKARSNFVGGSWRVVGFEGQVRKDGRPIDTYVGYKGGVVKCVDTKESVSDLKNRGMETISTKLPSGSGEEE